MRGLEASDRWSAAEIATGTQSQLMLLLEWAANNAPYYRRQGTLKGTLKILRRSPERFDEQWLQLPEEARTLPRFGGPPGGRP